MKFHDPNLSRLAELNRNLVTVLLSAESVPAKRDAGTGQFTVASTVTAQALRRAWGGAGLAPSPGETAKKKLIAALRAKNS